MYLIFLLLIMSGCYGINRNTSEIENLNTDCLNANTWHALNEKYSTQTINDTAFIKALNYIENDIFKVDVLYFESSPRELIAVAKDHYSVRYVFNPNLSPYVLDGLSPELNKDEKKRITNRVQRLLMNYQCSEGKEESRKKMQVSIK